MGRIGLYWLAVQSYLLATYGLCWLAVQPHLLAVYGLVYCYAKKIKITPFTLKQNIVFHPNIPFYGHQYANYSGDADASAIAIVELGLVPMVQLLRYNTNKKKKPFTPKNFPARIGDTDKDTEYFLG